MRFGCYPLILCALCSLWCETAGAQAPKKYALSVGVEDYESAPLRQPTPLKYAVEDATELASLLTQAGFEVSLLTDDTGRNNPRLRPTKANVESQLRELANKCQRADTLLLAFAGHGVQFAGDKEAYFCPQDARPFARDKDTLVSISHVYASMESSHAGVKVILVDACRNDPDPGRGRGVNSESSPPPPRGVAVLFSCSAGERAFEHDSLQHGVFFHHVIEGLKGEAKNRRGTVTFDDLAIFVRSEVHESVQSLLPGRSQSPNLKADLIGVPPVLIANTAGATARPMTTTDANEYLSRGNAALERGDQTEALRLFNEAIRRDPRLAEAYLARSLIWLGREELDKALEDCNQAVTLDPTSAAFNLRGTVRRLLKDLDEAWADQNRSLQADGSYAAAYYERGLLRELQGDRRNAINDFTKSISLPPKSPDPFLARADCWYDLGEYRNALRDLDTLVQEFPDDSGSHGARAELLATCPDDQIRNGRQALVSASKAWELKVPGEELGIAAALSAAYAETGDFNAALRWADKALSYADSDDAREFAQERLDQLRQGNPIRNFPQAASDDPAVPAPPLAPLEFAPSPNLMPKSKGAPAGSPNNGKSSFGKKKKG